MRFNEFMQRLEAASQKVRDIQLKEISESILVNGDNITVILEPKTGVRAEVNGNSTGLRYLRTLYTRAKEEFDAMLESLEESADQVSVAMTGILTAITAEAIPGLVVKRLTGENPAGDPKSILNGMIAKKKEELWKIWHKGLKDTVLSSFSLTVECGHDEGDPAHLNMAGDDLSWESFNCGGGRGSQQVHEISLCLNFLAQFDLIKATMQKWIVAIQSLNKLAEEK